MTKRPFDLPTAIGMASFYHGDTKDHGGEFYILHSIRVMNKMDTNDERILAVFHDTIEDTDLTIAHLLDLGMADHLAHPLNLLTHVRSESYESYIEKIAGDAMARKVKIADLEDNINMLRLPYVSDQALRRSWKYSVAWRKLMVASGRPVPVGPTS